MRTVEIKKRLFFKRGCRSGDGHCTDYKSTFDACHYSPTLSRRKVSQLGSLFLRGLSAPCGCRRRRSQLHRHPRPLLPSRRHSLLFILHTCHRIMHGSIQWFHLPAPPPLLQPRSPPHSVIIHSLHVISIQPTHTYLALLVVTYAAQTFSLAFSQEYGG